MKKFRKNNKGFSLVELIVVVLIIAIIAVALAPQVIKWVQQARDNTKKNNEATVKSAIQTCVADYLAAGGAIKDGTVITVTKASVADSQSNAAVTISGASKTLAALITDATEGKDFAETFYYAISTTGAVTVTTAP